MEDFVEIVENVRFLNDSVYLVRPHLGYNCTMTTSQEDVIRPMLASREIVTR